MVCNKIAEIFFIFVEGHIDAAVAGCYCGAACEPHNEIRKQALPPSVFFPYPEIVKFFFHDPLFPRYRKKLRNHRLTGGS